MELRPITLALNILTTAFAERGASIESIKITYDKEHPLAGGLELTLPDLSWKEITIPVDELNTLLNTSLPASEWIVPFKRMTLKAEVIDDGKKLLIRYPAYRADILHIWDIFEDAAIGYGYNNIPADLSKVQTTGTPHSIIPLVRRFQRALTGEGFSEVKTLTLTGEKDSYFNMAIPTPDDDVLIHNPITEDHTRLRTSLIPGLLSILRANRHRELPQMIFEPGIVVEKNVNVWKGAGVAIHSKAGFTEMKSKILSFLPAFGIEYSIASQDHPSFVPGRCASIVVDNNVVGNFGELHPGVVSIFELEYPVIAFEFDLGSLKN